MSIAIAIGFGPTIIRSAGWSPLSLGASLLAWWDSSSGISLSSDKVTAWGDRVAGYSAAQGTDASRPTYSTTSFNGAPGLTFDGTDDHLTLASQPFPSGANASEIWAVLSQDALPADATTRMAVSYGGDASTNRRSLARIVSTGVNMLRVQAGDGATTPSTGPVTDFSTRHVARCQFNPTAIAATLDSGSAVSSATVPATGTSRLRIGAISNTSAANYWNGKIRDVVITGALTAAQATQLQTFLLARR